MVIYKVQKGVGNFLKDKLLCLLDREAIASVWGDFKKKPANATVGGKGNAKTLSLALVALCRICVGPTLPKSGTRKTRVFN